MKKTFRVSRKEGEMPILVYFLNLTCCNFISLIFPVKPHHQSFFIVLSSTKLEFLNSGVKTLIFLKEAELVGRGRLNERFVYLS